MILQSLRDLALREGLVDDPAFESKPVRWVIELRPDGRFRQLYDTNTPQALPEGSKRKPKLEAKLMVIPRRAVRSSGVRANFLVDNAKYVLGFGAIPEETDAKNAERHTAYLQLLKDAQRKAPSPELDSVLAFLSNDEQRNACRDGLNRQGGFADNDLFTFEVEGELLHEAEALRQYWACPQGSAPESNNDTQCLICGEQRPAATLHNQIQIRGGSTSGVPLVSFNAEAFEKYGWSGNANAPVCTECMTAYVESLRRLTRPRYVNPRTGESVQPLSTVLNGDTTAVYWADNDDPLISGLSMVRDDPKKVKDLLASPRLGLPASAGDATRFFCLILTGTQGRAIVRRIHTGTVAEVQGSLNRYFAAIDVDRYDRSSPLPQFVLLKSMVLNGELDRLPAELATELWMAALFGLPLSRSFLAAVITRIRVEQQELRSGKRKVSPERAALLQFYFASHGMAALTGSKRRTVDQTEEETLPMGLDVTRTDKAYLLGRVLAIAERMQMLAQPQGLNRTVVDRFYSTASVRPALVFTELLKLYRYHRTKAMRDIFPLARKTDLEFGGVLLMLKPEDLSTTLTLEEQGRFGLGYYHQRQQFFSKKNGGAELPAATDSTTEETAAA